MRGQPRAAPGRLRFSADFLGLHRLQRPNPLLYRHFPAYLRSFAGVSFRSPAMSDPKSPDRKSESGFQYSLSNLKTAQPLEKVIITFPNGDKREFPRNITGFDIARSISPSLAKRTVAMVL